MSEWLISLAANDAERELLAALFTADQEVDVMLPPEISPEKLWDALTVCGRAYTSSKVAQEQIRPLIGRVLIALEDNPNVYQCHGYRTYDDLLTNGIPQLLGIPRSESYRIRKLTRAWPNLSPQEFQEVGSAKLHTLSTFTNGSDPASANWLQVAKTNTMDGLVNAIAAAGEVPRHDLIPAVITISTSVSVRQEWVAFVNNPQVQATVGTGDHGSILTACMAEMKSTHGI